MLAWLLHCRRQARCCNDFELAIDPSFHNKARTAMCLQFMLFFRNNDYFIFSFFIRGYFGIYN